MQENVCLEGYFFSWDQDGSHKHIPLTVCSICPGGRWACTDLRLVRGGVKAGISSCSLGGQGAPFPLCTQCSLGSLQGPLLPSQITSYWLL